ncbi:MAG: SCO family protein [Thiobacillaceae bacterium]
MTTLRCYLFIPLLWLSASLWVLPVQAESPGAEPEASDAQQWERGVLPIPDVIVVDQNGRKLRFYTDLVKGKTIAINFFYPTCVTMCLPNAAILRNVQRTLGKRVGRDVRFISLSVDPDERPAALKKFAQRFDVAPGWHFVSGNKADTDRLLTALGAFSGDKVNHSAMTLIINEPAHYWTRIHGLTPPPLQVETINQAASGALL